MVHNPFRPDTYKTDEPKDKRVFVESMVKVQIGVDKPAVIMTVDDAFVLLERLQVMLRPHAGTHIR